MGRWTNRALLALCIGIGLPATAGDRVRIVDEGGLGKEWRLADGASLAVPAYPALFAKRGDSVCVAIGYAVDGDGSTSDFSLLRGWSSASGAREPVPGYWQAFAEAGAGAVSQWKFAPRPEAKKPERTYTVATMHFMGREPMDPAALRGHCRIEDLAGLVQKMKSQGVQNGNLAAAEYQRGVRAMRNRQAPMARQGFPARR